MLTQHCFISQNFVGLLQHLLASESFQVCIQHLANHSDSISVTMVSRFMLTLQKEAHADQESDTLESVTGASQGKSRYAVFTTLAPVPEEGVQGNGDDDQDIRLTAAHAVNATPISGSTGENVGKGKGRQIDPSSRV